MNSFAFSNNENSNPDTIDHCLCVIQNPIRARSCGFGEKDRRPIDPPPILRLDVRADQTQAKSQRTTLFLLVQCELMDEYGVKSCNLVSIPISRSISNIPSISDEESGKPMSGLVQLQQPERARNLTGATHSNAYHLKDDRNTKGIFFIFNDLSVRTEGIYTLKFTLIDFCPRGPHGTPSGVLSVAFSAPFTVYSPKKFPGMTESTRLSRAFAKQGIQIAIRKVGHSKRVADGHYDAEDKNQGTNSRKESDSQMAVDFITDPVTSTNPKRNTFTRIPIEHVLSDDQES
ncbi:hypothetical protein J3Q64DRAFT_1052832 [Phycomyces blakesleeanus]|uniref:Velvet domain-containing protein n=2 Tax=Phycomyces blakesleeanus TaxID=4837 RepID=A0A167K445_PHYB8|nr:hypothetical protein PHYBLDRAFT_78768 [Phycomyces blakesleeanus NRRL 1555(-)]OAD67238.1 hypothetical protein PHYBLDRAFT_78768 [Phycomyces blakesleeanus NRRL 1555(-)]|eukprot:XP_018285278.1 hypothetical protein PHYBLDRAFT_78768 [Phycomyces blakesleeanus NRRL 1555(-)]